jgi:predicted nucleic acid-binding protein
VITAIDSSILIDVLSNDARFGRSSLAAIRDAAAYGPLIVCPIVWAEVRAAFASPARMERAFLDAGIAFDPFDRDCADVAGAQWRDYRRSGGTRTRLIADFFIGAHAQVRGGRLLTRDRGFYRRYFTKLLVLGGEATPFGSV